MNARLEKYMATQAKIENFYTINEVSKILRVSEKTVSNWISARKITAVKGKPVLIPESALKAFITKRTKRAII